jgi:hypothetical protein
MVVVALTESGTPLIYWALTTSGLPAKVSLRSFAIVHGSTAHSKHYSGALAAEARK